MGNNAVIYIQELLHEIELLRMENERLERLLDKYTKELEEAKND